MMELSARMMVPRSYTEVNLYTHGRAVQVNVSAGLVPQRRTGVVAGDFPFSVYYTDGWNLASASAQHMARIAERI